MDTNKDPRKCAGGAKGPRHRAARSNLTQQSTLEWGLIGRLVLCLSAPSRALLVGGCMAGLVVGISLLGVEKLEGSHIHSLLMKILAMKKLRQNCSR